MQKGIIAIILCLLILAGTLILEDKSNQYDDCLRIHIRANSNSETDQTLKYQVRDEMLSYLTPLLSEAKTKKQAKRIIKAALPDIKEISQRVIKEKGYNYDINCQLRVEDFPLRSYGGITFQSGSYEALIIDIGEGQGDNWWCVAFPPLCFVPQEGSDEIIYKSKILEIINKYKEKREENGE